MNTKKCIACNKEAEMWTGHVIDKRGNKIIAGWCEKHFNAHRNEGLFGRWRKCMGKEKTV